MSFTTGWCCAEGAIDGQQRAEASTAHAAKSSIGATTLDEFRKYIEKDAALERRFQQIIVIHQARRKLSKLLGFATATNRTTGVQITDKGLEAAVELSDRYITGRCLPDKAIDVIDEAGARIRLKATTRPPDLKEIDAGHRTAQCRKGSSRR